MRRAAVRQFIHHCQCDRTPLRPTDMHTHANMTATQLYGQMQMQEVASVAL